MTYRQALRAAKGAAKWSNGTVYVVPRSTSGQTFTITRDITRRAAAFAAVNNRGIIKEL